MSTFVRWGPAHLTAIALTILLPLALAWWSRKGNTSLRSNLIAAGFAALLLGQILVLFFWLERGSNPRWQDMLPLHLCDLMVFACAAACLSRKQWFFDLAYFWGLAGTLHGLLTPDLATGFPAPQYWFFFLGHGGIVGSVLFLMAGLRLRPTWRSVVHAYLSILVYGVLVGLFNLWSGTNYGYLCEKPGSASLMDHLGPWPWYILSLALVGLVSFVILYLPWSMMDARSYTRQKP